MAKTYQFKKDTTINVEYLTDGFDGHENFHVTEIRGLDSVDVQAGINFGELPYYEQAFIDFATDKGMTLAVWDDETFVGNLVTE